MNFDARLFLLSAELEFRWLLCGLGYDAWTADLRAFQMTAELANSVRDMQTLWEAKE